MPEEKEPLQEAAREVKAVTVTEATQVPEVYANSVIPVITSFDITLHFGSIIEIVGAEAKVARRVSIVMTPEVAKMLNLQLSFGLAGYEKNVRPILSVGKIVPNPQPHRITTMPEDTKRGSE